MTAITVLMAICIAGIAFMVTFFVALCRECRRVKVCMLLKVDDRLEDNASSTRLTVGAQSGIRLVDTAGASEASGASDVA